MGVGLQEPWYVPRTEFAGARALPHPEDQIREIKQRSRRFREQMLEGPQVLAYHSIPLIRVPYPTKFGLWRAGSPLLSPLLHIENRMYVVQFKDPLGQSKTLLISPSDVVGNRETPYFKRLGSKARLFGELGESLLAPIATQVPDALARLGLRPEDVDYVSYDHLHTQELRRWLGGAGDAPLFPRAKLIVHEREWASVKGGLFPLQRDWYCPQGTEVPEERVLTFGGDVDLGAGLALISTPGHTAGNHSFVVHTPVGLLVSSENGISPDCYAPQNSRIPGLRRYARLHGAEVVLNGNTLETGSNDQYLSMIKEKEVAGLCRENPDFTNVFPSSQLAPCWAFPRIRPSYRHPDYAFGTLTRFTS